LSSGWRNEFWRGNQSLLDDGAGSVFTWDEYHFVSQVGEVPVSFHDLRFDTTARLFDEFNSSHASEGAVTRQILQTQPLGDGISQRVGVGKNTLPRMSSESEHHP